MVGSPRFKSRKIDKKTVPFNAKLQLRYFDWPLIMFNISTKNASLTLINCSMNDDIRGEVSQMCFDS